MTPEQIKLDEAEHAKMLAKSAFKADRHCHPLDIISRSKAAGLDAANTKAIRRDDIESGDYDRRATAYGDRLGIGFSMTRYRDR